MMEKTRSFRLNCRDAEMPTVEHFLAAQGFDFEPDPFFPSARRLLHEPFPLGRSLAAFFGLIYIQDRSSMLPPLALNPPPGACVLDMCSSPGSKTGQLAQLTGTSGFILGNEPGPSRLVTLRRNMGQLNLPQVATCCRKGEDIDLPDACWEYIQLDPPCSGWGTVERNPKVMEIWTKEKTLPLVALQRALLREACRLLQPGGFMTYSTCTTNKAENEEQIAYARDELGLVPEAMPTLSGFQLTENSLGQELAWRLEPGDGQGFFIARLRKPEGAAPTLPQEERLEYEEAGKTLLNELGLSGGDLPGPVGIFQGSLHVMPQKALDLLPAAFRWQGMYLGKADKSGGIRLSPRLRLGNPPLRVELEGAQGISLLEGLLQGQSLESATMPMHGDPAKAKSALLCWEGLPLGRASLKNKRLIWSER